MIVDEKEAKEGFVKSEVHNHISTILFYHPKGNALPTKLLKKLKEEIDHASHDDNIRVILLRSVQHDVFCSGAYFNELLEIKDQQAAQKFFMGFADVVNSMRKCAKLIVARVHGKVVGGGLGLVAAADYAIALEGADVRLSELSIGIGPYVIAPAMVRKMGLSSFSQLAIDAHLWRNSDWARRKGLYAELHPNKASLEESIERLTSSLSKNSLAANTHLKRMLWEGTEDWDNLLPDRAAKTGELLLQEQAQQFLAQFNKSVIF